MKINVNPADSMVKKPHQRGSCHQSGEVPGEKFCMIFTKIRLGKAISSARGERRPRMFPGTILFLIIKKPISPIPRRTATDSNVVIKSPI
jgi:hypothetical protein